MDLRDDSGPLYGELLRLDTLLGLQRESAAVHDAHFCFAVHQTYELLFKIILYELDGAVAAVSGGDVPQAIYCLRRVRAVENVLVTLVGAVETISPAGFAAIRRGLARPAVRSVPRDRVRLRPEGPPATSGGETPPTAALPVPLMMSRASWPASPA